MRACDNNETRIAGGVCVCVCVRSKALRIRMLRLFARMNAGDELRWCGGGALTKAIRSNGPLSAAAAAEYPLKCARHANARKRRISMRRPLYIYTIVVVAYINILMNFAIYRFIIYQVDEEKIIIIIIIVTSMMFFVCLYCKKKTHSTINHIYTRKVAISYPRGIDESLFNADV